MIRAEIPVARTEQKNITNTTKKKSVVEPFLSDDLFSYCRFRSNSD